MSSKKKGLLFLSVTILCWGVLAIAIKAISPKVNSYNLAFFRFAFAFLCLFIYQGLKKPSYLKIFQRPPLLAILGGLFLGGNYLGFNQGVKLTSPAITQIMIQFGPLCLGLSGLFLFKERINKFQVFGFILATTGFFMFYRDQLSVFLDHELLNTGIFWTLGGAISWTLYAILQKKMILTFPASQLNLLIFFIPCLAFLPLTHLEEFLPLSLGDYLILVFLGANTLIAYGCLSEAFKYLPANNISILITLNPLITLGVVELLHQLNLDWIPHSPIQLLGYTGAFLVITGAILVVGMGRISKVKNR